jgi:apolipoprotein N-acyltransferase
VAPLPWLLIICRPTLADHRPYLKLYLASVAFWLLAIHWLRLPHPATSLGWLALSAYLGCYLPLFVGLSRVAVHRLRLPLWLVAPTIWTGLELARAHLLTGFLMAALGHTQAHQPILIQISDIVGGYGVSFLIMLAAACVTILILPRPNGTFAAARTVDRGWFAVIVAVISVGVTLIYGQMRLAETERISDIAARTGPRVAIVQGNSLATWKHESNRQQQIMEEYVALSEQAVREAAAEKDQRPLDLLVWPETMFRTSLVTADEGVTLPAEVHGTIDDWKSFAPRELAALTLHLQTAVLVGIDRRHVLADEPADEHGYPAMRAYNASVLVNQAGDVVATYDKVHRVMFGEYVPLVGWVPFFDRIAALTGGIDAGSGPVAMPLGGIVYAPNICYETVIPHVIRNHFRALSRQSAPPDVLVNLTNDAWYWGSSELDMHLACDVFRAVECRRPMIVAANGGISASIDSNGRIVEQSPRQQPDVIIADVTLDRRNSPYMAMGDWFAGACLLSCCACAIIGLWKPRAA